MASHPHGHRGPQLDEGGHPSSARHRAVSRSDHQRGAGRSADAYRDGPQDPDAKKARAMIGEKFLAALALYYALLVLLVVRCDLQLPKPVPASAAVAGDGRGWSSGVAFSEERARHVMEELSSIGPKVVGSHENEVLAVDYILRQVELVRAGQRRNENGGPVNPIETDVQYPAGCFYIDLRDGFTSCYRNVTNIVVRIGPKTNRSLLVNAHFDSVPGSPGASDDVVNCAAMLEALRVISQRPHPLPNSIIFLFNGAEENILQASHGFITQHPWAKEVVAFVNLEACGAGGKEILFQAGPDHPWLLNAYVRGAKHPAGSVVAQEVFQSGLVISDTDYRIFRDYGRIPGLDFAFVKNGYVYHTKYDRPEFVTPGSIQRLGENLLGILREAVPSLHLARTGSSKGKMVFFDVLGLFMVSYQGGIGTVINVMAAVVSLTEILLKGKQGQPTSTMKHKLVSLLVLVASLLIAVACCCLVALVLTLTGHVFSWYGQPFWILGLYVCPSLATLLWIHAYVARRRRKTLGDDWFAEENYFDSGRLFLVICVCVLTSNRVHSAFLPAAWIIFPFFVRSIGERILVKTPRKAFWWRLVFLHLGMQVPPLLLTLYCCWQIYAVFIPILGRAGPHLNPEYTMAILTAAFVFFCTIHTVSLLHVVRSCKRTVALLMAICLASVAVICWTDLGFPYSADPSSPRPQRYLILHTERTHFIKAGDMKTSDSGYWIVPLDYNGIDALQDSVPELRHARPVDCDSEIYCGMPYYFPVFTMLKKSHYLPAPKPKVVSPRKFELVGQKVPKVGVRRMFFRFTGPNHMALILCPKRGVSLLTWSISKEPLRQGPSFGDRPTYFVYYSQGTVGPPWQFWIDLKVPGDHPNHHQVLDVLFMTHYLQGDESHTEEFPAFLRKLPPWVYVTSFTSTVDRHAF